MERLSEPVLGHVQASRKVHPCWRKDCCIRAIGPALDQALSRPVRRGALLRVGRGVYVLRVESRFGRGAPAVEKTVGRIATAHGERVANSY